MPVAGNGPRRVHLICKDRNDMLEALRRGVRGIIVQILLGLLVISFALWGVADVFRGYGQGALAKIGNNLNQCARIANSGGEIQKTALADIPGLIEGAHEGAGLGTRFLGHVERCRALLHLVDATSEDVAASYKTVRAELKAYGGGLARKKELVALTKCDALTEDVIAEKAAELQRAARKKPLLISAVSGQGMKEALFALAREVERARADEKAAEREAAGVSDPPYDPLRRGA